MAATADRCQRPGTRDGLADKLNRCAPPVGPRRREVGRGSRPPHREPQAPRAAASGRAGHQVGPSVGPGCERSRASARPSPMPGRGSGWGVACALGVGGCIGASPLRTALRPDAALGGPSPAALTGRSICAPCGSGLTRKKLAVDEKAAVRVAVTVPLGRTRPCVSARPAPCRCASRTPRSIDGRPRLPTAPRTPGTAPSPYRVSPPPYAAAAAGPCATTWHDTPPSSTPPPAARPPSTARGSPGTPAHRSARRPRTCPQRRHPKPLGTRIANRYSASA